MKRIINAIQISLFFLVDNSLVAQFQSAIVGIDGLTCSACSKATEQSILKLDFVEYLDMNLTQNTAYVVFKLNSLVDVSKLSQSVYNAGFSVRHINVIFNFTNLNISNNSCFQYQNKNYMFINVTESLLNGSQSIKFIHKKMLSRKNYNSYKKLLPKICIDNIIPDYYITLE